MTNDRRTNQSKIKGGSTEWLESLLYNQWERLRRNRHYINLCEKLTFNEDGLYDEFPQHAPDADAILARFNLQYIYHPSTDIPKDEILSYEIFKEPLAVTLEYQASKHPETEQSQQCSIKTKHLGDESRTLIVAAKHSVELSPIWDDHYIRVKIDIGTHRTMEEILDEVTEFVQEARRIADIEREDVRNRFDKNAVSFKVWDLRKTRKSFPEIGRLLGLSADRARKHFYAAYKLIYNEQYEHAALDLVQSIGLHEAKKHPSQFYEAYVNQDHHARKEQHVFDEDLLVDLEADPQASAIARLTIEKLQRTCMECPDRQCFEHFQQALISGDQGKWEPCEIALDIRMNG